MKQLLRAFPNLTASSAQSTIFPASVEQLAQATGTRKALINTRLIGQSEKQRAGMGWGRADIAAIAVLMFLIAQLFLSARTKSATYDEQYHIANGITFLRTGDPRLVPEHPPLINIIAALPLLADHNLVLPLDDRSWQDVNSLRFSELLLWKLNPDGPLIIALARLPIMALTLLLALIVYAWGREMYGPWAALLALTLLSFDPNILAHGCLATNDVGLTCFVALALYAFWRLLRKPGLIRAVIAGIALGLALVSKFSAIFLLPTLIVIALADRFFNPVDEASRQKIKYAPAHFAVLIVAASFTVWAVYGFQVGTLKGYTVPARAYLRGLQDFTHLLEQGKTSFLLGSYSDTGWWYYFPVAFAVKTPLPTILLIVFSLVYAFSHRTWRLGLPLLIPAVIYFGACLASPFNIGYRHLLPLLPLMFIFAGQLARINWRPVRRPAWIIGMALVWLVISSLKVFPHYLAYFNELVGGPDGGYRVLIDSNLDWGQDLIGLREYMARENIESVKLSYLGTADPAAYGITYEPLPGYPYNQWQSESLPDVLLNPPAGVYAISVSNLQGLRFKNHNLYAGFRERKPDAIIGHSIFVYRISPAVDQSSAR